jgi:hypothetical protein
MGTALLSATAAVALAMGAIAIGFAKIMLVKRFDHAFARYAAGIHLLQADETFPRELVDSLAACGTLVNDKKFIREYVSKRRPLKRNDVDDAFQRLVSKLTPEQETIFAQTSFSLLLAISFATYHGSRYRQYLFDRVADRQTVVRQTHALFEKAAPAGLLCAA